MTESARLVLMSCCAPCSAGAIRQLKSEAADFIVLFYNPNIFPKSEYQKRLAEQIKYCEKLGVKYAVGEYDHDNWLKCVATGRENEPERGRRCAECFKHRFAFGAKWAKENGYNAIASVFGVSKHKSQEQVDEAGTSVVGADIIRPQSSSRPTVAPAAKEFVAPDGAIGRRISAPTTRIHYLSLNWNDALRQEINRAENFYRQSYCGCEFSFNARE